ncbi:hypothetical protein [Streptomyces sp. NBC_01167]|uniref:hypothetical protein n=1 Tax=Streptomyces sp. NBC_01167 TaxID=2903756 RepID=UPI0038699C48
MPMRSHRLEAGATVDSSTARSRRAGSDPAGMLPLGFALYAGACLPGVSLWHCERPGGVQVWAIRRDGFATAATGEDVWQFGVADLWDEIEYVFLEYAALGSPDAEEFGMTVDADGQHVWLREPPHQSSADRIANAAPAIRFPSSGWPGRLQRCAGLVGAPSWSRLGWSWRVVGSEGFCKLCQGLL